MDGSVFWRQLPDQDRKALTAVARSRTFPGGSVLCTEGEPTTHVFILLSGWVKVITVSRDGRETLAALRGEGDIIGEMSGQLAGYRTATVQAFGSVRALIAGARQFEDFLNAHPGAASAHRRAMAHRLGAAHGQQRAHAMTSGAQRLADLLLNLAERDTPPLSQDELASLIGASRSTVTRALHQWRSRHIIGTDPRRIEILDRIRLMRIAGRDSNGTLPSHAISSASLQTRCRNDDHGPGGNSSIVPD